MGREEGIKGVLPFLIQGGDFPLFYQEKGEKGKT